MEHEFLRRIDDNDDWKPHALSLADWLEERGDPRAKGWRWLVNNGCEPRIIPGSVFWWGGEFPYEWREFLNPVYCTSKSLTPYYNKRSEALADAVQAMMKTEIFSKD